MKKINKATKTRRRGSGLPEISSPVLPEVSRDQEDEMKYKALYPGLRIEREDIGEVITLVEELCDGSWECEIEEAQLIDPEGDYIDDNFEWVKYEYSYTAAELRGWIR